MGDKFMKVAVISDIHANNQAFETVLEDIKAQGCDCVWCLGDIAMAGPQPRIVIDFVSEQKDWVVIQGNTDKLIADFCPAVFNTLKNKFPVMANALADDILFIEDERKDFLRNLPPQKELNVDGVKVLLVHGSPRRNNEDILPGMKISEVEEMIKGTDADLILCGHTHRPAGYQTSKKQTVVNVGSVGRPMTPEPKACYAIVDFHNGEFSVKHRFLDYDYEFAATLMEARDYEGSDKIAEMLRHPGTRHV